MEVANMKASCVKMTFWNKIRVTAGISCRELADLMGVSVGTIGNWFSGHSVPLEKNIVKLCDFFDVDYDTGYNAFVQASRAWHAEKNTPNRERLYSDKELPSKTTSTKSDDSFVLANAEDIESPTLPSATQIKISDFSSEDDICRMLYGNLDFTDFLTVADLVRSGDIQNSNTLREFLYGKIPLELFDEVSELL
jgi:transcriptional regulator with XRE-family HTH domain